MQNLKIITFGLVSLIYSLNSITFSQTLGGCTNPQAVNFNPAATFDDGSCELIECGGEYISLSGNIHLSEGSWPSEVSWYIFSENGIMYLSGGAPYNQSFNLCLPSQTECLTFVMQDSYGDGWNGANAIITSETGEVLLQGTIEDGYEETLYFGLNYEGECGTVVYGCTSSIALNYNPYASQDDNSCILSTQFNGYDIFLQPYPNYEPIPWSPYNSSNLDVFEDNYGGANGKQNTQDIVDFYGTEESYAANYCYNLEQHGYSDWYLPSSDELGAFHSYLSSEWESDLMDYYSNTEVASGNQIAEQTIGCCFSQPLTSPGIFYWTSNENYPSESATLKKIFENSEWHDNKSNTHPV